MKKILVFIFVLLGCLSLGVTVLAEETTEPSTEPVSEEVIEEEPIVEEKIAKVVIGECQYGSATVDIQEGKVGDIVTIYPNVQVFCSLQAVKVNGTVILKNDNNEYQFALAEGENVVTVECAVSQEDMKIIADLINNAGKGNWEEIFSVDNILNLVIWAISILFGSGFLITLLKNKKIKAITADEISGKIQSVVPETVSKVILEQFQPILDVVNNAIKDANNAIDTLVRSMTLMQENTPEARLAITKELESLGRSSTGLEKQVREIINQEMLKIEAAKKEKQEKLAALESSNNEVVDKFTTAEKTENEEQIDEILKGRI